MNSIHNTALSIAFSENGLPTQYSKKGLMLSGAKETDRVKALICHKPTWTYQDIELVPIAQHYSRTAARFEFTAYMGETPAVHFTVRYQLINTQLTVSAEQVIEQPDFELIEVSLSPLLSATRGWFAFCPCHGSGEVCDLSAAKIATLPEDHFFGKMLATLPIMMLGNAHIGAVMELCGYCDGALLSVEENDGEKCVLQGTIQPYRIDARRPVNTNDDEQSTSCGHAQTPNLLVEQQSICRIDFFDGGDEKPVDWFKGAQLVHRRIPRHHTMRYHGRMMYIAACDTPIEKEPPHTFAQVGEFITRVANLIDFAPQVVYLGGWQADGHDTGYPSFDEIGNRIGGYDGYLALKKVAETVNCTLSLDMNLDDAYENSPLFNEADIARLPDGRLWKSRRWTRDISYVTGLARYMTEGMGIKRIRRACNRYQLSDTVLVDVLSWFAIRHNWDIDHPASGVKNLYEGRFRVLDEFERCGVNVISEQLRYPMIGRLSCCVDSNINDTPFFGGMNVPIMPIVYRHAIMHGGETINIGKMLAYNAHPVQWFMKYDQEIEPIEAAQQYYLLRLPWFLLSPLDVLSMTREKTVVTQNLTSDSKIIYDEATENYSVFYQGIEIAKNGSISCPIDDTRIAFYSKTACTLHFPYPSHWNHSAVKAYILTETGRLPTEIDVISGYIHVSVKSGQPTIVSCM